MGERLFRCLRTWFNFLLGWLHWIEIRALLLMPESSIYYLCLRLCAVDQGNGVILTGVTWQCIHQSEIIIIN